jgi:mannose-1-phosphate guanylyltransferase / mannose-6-phosphate isomerase
LIQQVILCGRSGQALPHPIVEPIIVCGESQRASLVEQLRRAGAASRGILIEPRRRGTAAALTLAAAHAVTLDDPVLLVVPGGVLPESRNALERAAVLARRGALVAFGVPPAAPLSGRAYIRARAEYIDAFVAQADAATAKAYADAGDGLWSTGIFALRASVWIDVIGSLRPDIFKACERAYRKGSREGAFLRVDAAAFAACPAQSVECAVMEKIAGELSTLETMVVRLDAGWSGAGRYADAA